MSQTKRKIEVEDASEDGHFPKLRQILSRGLPSEKEFEQVCDEIRTAVQRDPGAAREYLTYRTWYVQRSRSCAINSHFSRRRRGGRGSYRVQTNAKISPLFAACMVRAPLEIVKLVHRAHPDAIREVNHVYRALLDAIREDDGLHGRTALHFACLRGAPVDVIEFLVETYPDAVEARDKEGRSPLFDAPSAALPLMIRKRPDSIWSMHRLCVTTNLPNNLPAVCSLFVRLPAAEVEALIHLLSSEHTEIFRKRDAEHGRTLLHWTCNCWASADIIQLLVREMPEALRAEDKDGNTPLHCCISSEGPSFRRGDGQGPPDLALIRQLLSADPSLVTMTNREGESPLSMLWRQTRPEEEDDDNGMDSEGEGREEEGAGDNNRAPWWDEDEPLRDAVYLLLRAGHYGSVSDPLPPLPNVGGGGGEPREFRPLHAACASGCPTDLFELILNAHSERVRERDEEGNTAMALSLRRSATSTWEDYQGLFIEGRIHCEELLKLRPELARMADSDGRLPLHVALEAGHTWCRWSDFFVRDLVNAVPEAVGQCDPRTQMFPFQLAAVHAAETNDEFDANTVYELLRRFPDLVVAQQETPSGATNSSAK